MRSSSAVWQTSGSEACLLFGSGYLANTGVVAALSGPGEVVLSDALNHASIVDGCCLSRALTMSTTTATSMRWPRRCGTRGNAPR